MSVRVVYSKSYGVKYKASICSKAFILYAIITLLTFILPLLLCYRSNGKFYIFTLVETKYYLIM